MKYIFGFIAWATSMSCFAFPWTPPTYESQKVTYKVERRELYFENDRYESKVTTICSATLDIAAGDFRNMPEGAVWEAPPAQKCKLMVDGREREFWIYFSSMVARDFSSRSVKSYGLSLWFSPLDNLPETIPSAPPNSASTRELNLKNLILESSAGQGVTCLKSSGPETTPAPLLNLMPARSPHDCAIVNPVVYAATAEFETR